MSAWKKIDNAWETTSSEGIGVLVVTGAYSNKHRTFEAAGMTNGDTCDIRIEHSSAGIAEWEECEATWGTVGTLTRGTLKTSSTGSRISFSAGVKNVFCPLFATRAVAMDPNGDAGVTRDWTVGRNQTISAAGILTWLTRLVMSVVSDGLLKISNIAGDGFTGLILGTNDASGIRIKKTGAAFNFRTGNDGADANIPAGAAAFSGAVTGTSWNSYTPENAANKGQVSGYASLDGDGKIPQAQLPAIAISNVYTAANQAARLALTAERGDACKQTDNGKTYLLSTDSPSTNADWIEIAAIVTEAAISLSDVTTGNASALAHGWLKKLSGVATEFMNGAGNWITLASSAASGFRNRLINGSMRTDRRNSGAAQTFTVAAAIAYCIDRWYASCTGANITGQRVAGTGTNKYAYKFTGAASNSGTLFGQRIESINCTDLVNAAVANQIMAKSSTITSVTWTAYYANSPDDFSAKTQIATGTLTISSTLSLQTLTFNAGANAGNGIAIEYSTAALVAAATLQYEAAQLEPGTTATAFEVLPLQVEEELCARYLPAFVAHAAGNENIGVGSALNATTAAIFWKYPAATRNIPTGVTASSAGHFKLTRGDFTAFTADSFGAWSYGKTGAIFFLNDSVSNPFTVGQVSHMFSFSASAYFFLTGCEL